MIFMFWALGPWSGPENNVNFIFLVIAPESSTSQHLKALARISRLFKNPSLRESVLRTNEADQIYSILVDEDSKFI